MQNPMLVEKAMLEYTELLFRIAYYYLKDKQLSEDIVQEVFIKFYCSNYQEHGELKAYLSKMTANTCKDYLKSWSYKKILIQNKLFLKETTIHKDSLVETDELTTLDSAILSLPLKQREAIVYYYLENLTIKEVSQMVNSPESTVKSRLKSGKELLKKKLVHEDWEVLLHE
ncbi:sigma-70 family RNA polymerase sigma factor [Neobacillus muris]|uniref:sigma-70 family RNA polymerase sigma factor n=1 Tax=Neobacillus muris TaxID=2941334 RepID=UPI00203EB87F|nr:sigma-70 family RNA polymerase sigma factor [Neobacillus muris]